jgi:thioredoxin-like negative regulator of GroEL
LASGPDSAELQDTLGVALAAQGQLNDAVGHFERALQLDSEFGEAQLDLADVLIRQGQAHAAVALLEKAERSHAPDIVERARAMLQKPTLQ